MSEAIEMREGKLYVTKEIFKVETTTEEVISVRKFQTNPATVSIKAGFTCNLGNYESGRLDIMVSIPCYIEEIEETFQQVKKYVDEKMTIEYRDMKKSVGK